MAEVLRRRVGATPPPQAPNASGGVLRARVGDDPASFAKRIRDELEDDTPDEVIDQGDQQLAARGLDDQQRIQQYAEQGKKGAIRDYVTTKEPSRAQRVFALIADIGSGIAGRQGTAQQDLRSKYEQQNAEAQARGAQEAEVEAQAAQIREIFKQSGREIPEGPASAVVKIYGPLVRDLLKPKEQEGESLETYEAKKRIDAKYRATSDGPDYAQKRRDQIEDREDNQAAAIEAASARAQLTPVATPSERKGAQASSEELVPGIDRTRARVEKLKRAKLLFENLLATGPIAGRLGNLGPSDDREELASLLNQIRISSAPQGQGAVSNYERSLFASGVPGAENDRSAELYQRYIDEAEQAIRTDEARLSELEEITGRPTPRAITRGPVPAAAGAPPVTGGKVRVSNGSETFEIDPEDLPEAEAEGFKRVQ